jgi:Uma2 family endonuclease
LGLVCLGVDFYQLPNGHENVEAPSNPFSSHIAALFVGLFFIYLRQNPIAHLTTEGGGYMVAGEPYAPDAAILLKARQPDLSKQGYNPIAPDLAVEVVSPTDRERNLRIKIGNYLAAGTIVWVVYFEGQTVEVYTPGQPVRIPGIDDVLDADEILPGFKLPLREIFSALSFPDAVSRNLDQCLQLYRMKVTYLS